MTQSLTKETQDLMKTALGNPLDRSGNALAKTVNIASGLTFYDLQAPAKMLYPVLTPLRNSIPRVKRPHPGDAAHWKQINSLVGSGYDAMGWVPEGQRSARMSYNTANKSLTYVTLGEEDALTFEAEAAAEGFEDENALVSFRLLQKMMRKEEIGLLGGNATMQLGTPGTPTLSAATLAGATLPTATYSVKAVALTFEGWKSSNTNTLAASPPGGVATTKNITGADGNTFTLNGGSSASSLGATQAITLGQGLYATVPAVQGAVAYAWFVQSGATGAETLQAITTVSTVVFSAALTANMQVITAITGDNSANPNFAFDGVLTNALKPGNLSYVSLLPLQSAGNPSFLTASGRGSVVELDTMLQKMWDTFNLGPSVIWVNSQEQRNITNKCLSNASGPLLRYEVPTTPGQAYGIVAGGVIDYYYNPYTGEKIPVRVHPDATPGMLMGYCEKLPAWYQSNSVPNVAEILTRRDYYRMDWPLRTRQREYGVYTEEVLAVYATFAMGVIGNIGNG